MKEREGARRSVKAQVFGWGRVCALMYVVLAENFSQRV